MKVEWIEFRGKQILSIDYTGIKMEKEMIALTEKSIPFYEKAEKSSVILVLVDLTGCFATPGFMEAARKLESQVINNYKAKRAIIGISGPKAVLLKGFNLFAKQKLEPFATRDEALAYLIKA